MKLVEKLSEYDYSITKALSRLASMEESEAEEFTKNIALSDYLSLANALDGDDEDEVTRIVDKYINVNAMAESFEYFSPTKSEKMLESSFMEFLHTASIRQISEAKIFQKFDLTESNVYKHYTPQLVQEALAILEGMGFDETIESVKFFKEDAPYKTARDIFITTHVLENMDDIKFKQELSKLTRKTPAQITSPSYTDPQTKKKESIISVNSNNKTIATQDEKGEVEIVDVRDSNKLKQIATESLKRLAGLK